MLTEQQTRAAVRDGDQSDAEAYAALVQAHDDAQRALITALENHQEIDPPTDLTDRVELRNYLGSYTQQRSVEGAEAELNQELGLNTDNQVPIHALMEREQDRADVATTADGLNVQTAPIAERIFARHDVGFLGLPMPTVMPGTARYPYLASGTGAVTRKEGRGVDAVKAELQVRDVNPQRITARYLWGVESAAQLGAELESSLRSDLRMALGDALDNWIIVGNQDDKDADIPEFKGVLALLGAATQINGGDKAKASTYAAYRASIYDQLDGREYDAEDMVRLLIGLDTYKRARAVYFGNQTPQDAIVAMRDLGAMVRYSARIAAATAANNTDGAKQAAIYTVRPDSLVMPVWSGVTMIRDPYTEAAKGQIALTAHMLFGLGIRRGDTAAAESISGWKRLDYVISDKN